MQRRKFLMLSFGAAAGLAGCGGGASNDVVTPVSTSSAGSASASATTAVAATGSGAPAVSSVLAGARIVSGRDTEFSNATAMYTSTGLGNTVQGRAADGTLQWSSGTFGTGGGQFNVPTGIDETAGFVYVTDTGNHRLQVLDASGNAVRTIGPFPDGPSALLYPQDVESDLDGSLYVADSGHHRIAVFSTDGTFRFDFGGFGSDPGQLNGPRCVLSAADGLHVVDAGNRRVNVYDANGNFLRTYGSRATLFSPRDVAVDRAGNSYVVDQVLQRIVVFDAGGALVATFTPHASDGSVLTPFAATFDANGNLFITPRST